MEFQSFPKIPRLSKECSITEKISLFNVARWSESRPACCGVVPVLYSGSYYPGVVEDQMRRLQEQGSVAAPGFMRPEGIVLYIHGKLIKHTFEAK